LHDLLANYQTQAKNEETIKENKRTTFDMKIALFYAQVFLLGLSKFNPLSLFTGSIC
jgi:hypothetical protein